MVGRSPIPLHNTRVVTWHTCRYTSCYESLALKGLRVLSLGYRRVVDAPADGEHPREWVESALTFAGFIAFTCKTRADSRAVCMLCCPLNFIRVSFCFAGRAIASGR
jgi:hypothetical protein